MAGKQGGGSKRSKKDKGSRKRYHAEGHREENKKRRKAKHGPPGNGEAWKQAKAKRKAKRAMARRN